MDDVMAAQWRAHLSSCPDCARYDRVLRRGVSYLNAQPAPQVTPDFAGELQERLAVEERRLLMRPVTSLATASVLVAAMLAVAAWIPVLLLSRASDPTSVVASTASASTVASEIAWHAENAVERQLPAHVHPPRRVVWLTRTAPPVIEPKYSPVILESPIAPLRYAQTVSYGAE